jgi:hypothetical protein
MIERGRAEDDAGSLERGGGNEMNPARLIDESGAN